MDVTASSGLSVLSTGLQGVQTSQQSIQQSAADLVQAGTVDKASSDTLDVVEPLLNIQQQQQVFDASAKVIGVASDLLGSLIDIKA